MIINKLIDLEAFNRDESIISLAARLGFDLRKSGSNFTSPCPVCQDTGSKRHLTFYPKTNSFICHKCNQFKGTNFKLIQNALNLNNRETVKWIMDSFSNHKTNPVRLCSPDSHENKILEKVSSQPEIHLDIYQAFYSLLDLPDLIIHYLEFDRAITKDTISRFKLRGIAKNHYSLKTELQKRFRTDDLIQSGIMYQPEGKSPVLRFNDACVVFPHYHQGKLLYLSTRNLNFSIKSYKLPQQVFFNLDALTQYKTVYVFEGIINGLSYYQMTGNDNFICTLGIISESQYQSLIRTYSDTEFRFLYDPDEAGRKASYIRTDSQFYLKLFSSYGFKEIPLHQSRNCKTKPKEWDLNDLTIWLRDEYEERAALLEYCQGLSRPEAEARADIEVNNMKPVQ